MGYVSLDPYTLMNCMHCLNAFWHGCPYILLHFWKCFTTFTCSFARFIYFTLYGNPVYVIQVTKMSSTVHGVENRDSHAKSRVSVQLLGVPAWKDDDCMHMYMYGCACK